MDGIFGILTMCAKAGALEYGFDCAEDAIAKRKAGIVLLARDISAKTQKEIRYRAGAAGVPVFGTEYTPGEFSARIGKRAAILAVDKSFSDAVTKQLTKRGF